MFDLRHCSCTFKQQVSRSISLIYFETILVFYLQTREVLIPSNNLWHFFYQKELTNLRLGACTFKQLVLVNFVQIYVESFCDYSTTRRTSLALKKKMDRWTDKLLQRYNYMPSSYMAIQRNTCPNLWHQIKAQIELKEPHSEVEIFFVFHGLHEVLVLSIVLHLIHEVLVLSIVLHLIHEVLNLSRVLHGIHELLVLSIVFHLIHEVLYFPKAKVLYGLHEFLESYSQALKLVLSLIVK